MVMVTIFLALEPDRFQSVALYWIRISITLIRTLSRIRSQITVRSAVILPLTPLTRRRRPRPAQASADERHKRQQGNLAGSCIPWPEGPPRLLPPPPAPTTSH